LREEEPGDAYIELDQGLPAWEPLQRLEGAQHRLGGFETTDIEDDDVVFRIRVVRSLVASLTRLRGRRDTGRRGYLWLSGCRVEPNAPVVGGEAFGPVLEPLLPEDGVKWNGLKGGTEAKHT